MSQACIVNRYLPGEEPLLWKLFFDSTHIVNGRDYTTAQCQRWAPLDKDMSEWSARIQARNPFVARDAGQIVGFAELEDNGHLDYFYVHHAWQRRGIGRALYMAVETEALLKSISLLFLESSRTALPFFVSMGFEITKKEEHFICDAPAERFLMRKSLAVATQSAEQDAAANPQPLHVANL